jgi:prolyl 4-hydroxylase
MPETIQLAQYIFTVPSFLSDEECDEWIELSESSGYSQATVNSPGAAATVATNIRNNERVILDDSARTETLWTLAEAHCPKYHKGYSIIGLNERLRFYRYRPRARFPLACRSHLSTRERRKQSLDVYRLSQRQLRWRRNAF